VCLFISYSAPADDVSASLRIAQNVRELQVGSSREMQFATQVLILTGACAGVKVCRLAQPAEYQ